MGRILGYLSGAVIVLLLPLTVLALHKYHGSTAVFLLFSICFVTALLVAVPQPRSYVYTFFAAFLFFGFWLKLIVHAAWSIPLSEPIGVFISNAAQWDEALLSATAAASGLIVARGAHLMISRRGKPQSATDSVVAAPGWYPKMRRTLWMSSLVMMTTLNVLNFQYAFYQIGVNPKLILPAHLNAVAAWLINTGFALWFATMVFWDFRLHVTTLSYTLIGPLLEAMLSSLSALSRLSYLLHTAPYLLAMFEGWRSFQAALRRRAAIVLAFALVLGFGISLMVVSWLRINIYYLAYDPTLLSNPQQKTVSAKAVPGADISNQIEPAVRQVSKLFVDRWIGLEGVMAVSSYPGLGLDLLADAIREDPKLGRRSLYQRIANVEYLAIQPERLTFLSNAGVAALLLLSGSKLLVTAGMAVITLVMLGTETITRRLTANPFLLSVAGVAMANVVVQMTFPYLTLIFFFQLWIAVVFLGGLQGIGSRHASGISA